MTYNGVNGWLSSGSWPPCAEVVFTPGSALTLAGSVFGIFAPWWDDVAFFGLPFLIGERCGGAGAPSLSLATNRCGTTVVASNEKGAEP